MNAQQPENLLRHRIKFIALIAVFLSPFIAGWMALYVFDLKPTSGNAGQKIDLAAVGDDRR
jgi:hypothetical protein